MSNRRERRSRAVKEPLACCLSMRTCPPPMRESVLVVERRERKVRLMVDGSFSMSEEEEGSSSCSCRM